MKDKKTTDSVTKRAIWEEKHHRNFDHKEKRKMCQECGEFDGRHTYTCIYYDTTSILN